MLFRVIRLAAAAFPRGSSLHTIRLMNRVMEEGLRRGRDSSEGSQRRMDGSWRGGRCSESGRWRARGETVAEVAGGGGR